MQFDPKILNGPILAHTGLTDFSPWGKKHFFYLTKSWIQPYPLKTEIFTPFFQLSGAILVIRDFENITFNYFMDIPNMCNKICIK